MDSGVTQDAGSGQDAGSTMDAGSTLDAGMTDAGSDADAGMVDAGMLPDAGQWAWVDVPGSQCGNGKATGFGVNEHDGANDLLIYLEGGGACWDTATCRYAATNIQNGYQGPQFAQDSTKRAPPFDRFALTNPTRNMHFALVPYCTGDVHTGDRVADYPGLPQFGIPAMQVAHKGAMNMKAFLPLLKQRFPNVKRVFITGSSAGAYGAQYHYAAAAATWPTAEVHMLADCGQMLNPTNSLLSTWIANWNMVLPADCVDCNTDFAKFPLYLHKKFPTARFGLLAFTQDGTLSKFMGYDGPTFEAKTRELLADDYDTTTNAKYYLIASSSHLMLGGLNSVTAADGTKLVDWVTAFIDGSANWKSVKPAP